MMLYPAMSKLNSHVPNRYMLVNVVARRARQIADDADEAGIQLDESPASRAFHPTEYRPVFSWMKSP